MKNKNDQTKVAKRPYTSGMYLPNPSITGRMWHKVNFKAEYTWF